MKHVNNCLASIYIYNLLRNVGQSDAISEQHYGDVIMGAIASQITSLTSVYSTVYSDADQIEHQSSASLAFVRGIHRGPVNSSHKCPVTRKMFPFDDVIMEWVKWCGASVRRSRCFIYGNKRPELLNELNLCVVTKLECKCTIISKLRALLSTEIS